MHLLALPSELLCKITEYLPSAKDVVSLCLTCKTVDEPVRTQYDSINLDRDSVNMNVLESMLAFLPDVRSVNITCDDLEGAFGQARFQRLESFCLSMNLDSEDE